MSRCVCQAYGEERVRGLTVGGEDVEECEMFRVVDVLEVV